MPGVSKNSDRKCFVDETELTDAFKLTVYPSLMALDHEVNNMICGVKELQFKFLQDVYISQRLLCCAETLIGELNLKTASIVEKQIDTFRKAKIDMLAELRLEYVEIAKRVDEQIKKIFAGPEISRQEGFVKKRVEDIVFRYNDKAEIERSKHHRFELRGLYTSLSNQVAAQLGHANPFEEPEPVSPRKQSGSSGSSNSGQEIVFKSKNLGLVQVDPKGDTSSMFQTGTDGGLPKVVPVPQPQPQPQPKVPELTDDEFKSITEKTKLSAPEDVQVEGLSKLRWLTSLSVREGPTPCALNTSLPHSLTPLSPTHSASPEASGKVHRQCSDPVINSVAVEGLTVLCTYGVPSTCLQG